MANRKNTFLLKRSNVAGNVPTAGQILLGELALNTADVKLYASGTTTNSILPIGWDRISRTGDTMTGTLYVPTISATTYQNLPNDLPISGTTGQILAKNSNANYDVTWIDNYTSKLQHTVKAGVAITKGQAVYVTGANGTNMIVGLASNTSEATSSKTLGLLAQDLALNGQGFVITEGLLAGLNTGTATAGDPVWLGINGNLIFGLLNKPIAPAHLVYIGVVTRAQTVNGEIFVKPQNGFEFNELHDVLLTGVTNGDLVSYNSATSLWRNTKTLNGSYNVTGTLSANTISATTITANTFTGLASLATSATTALNATNVGITNNTTTNATYYPTFVSSTSGNQALNVDSSTLTFNPSTNTLTVPKLSGLASLATSATTALNATNSDFVSVTDDASTNANYYLVWTNNTNTLTRLFTDAARLTYNPSTDTLTTTRGVFTTSLNTSLVQTTNLQATNGITGATISATTYLNLPTDIRVTGGTYSSGTATFTNNTGGTFTVTGFSTGGGTFTGGTVTGPTNFTGGLTANTISATTISAGTLNVTSIPTIAGLTNYVSKFTSNGSFLGNSQIFDNGTNVGVNTTSPSTKLEVVGTNQILTLRTTYAPDLSQKGAILWKDATDITGAIDTRYNGTTVDMYFGSLYNSGYNTTPRMVIKGNGYIGINTTTPNKWLDVNGDALINGLTVGLGNGSTNDNAVLGVGALGSNSGGYYNVAINRALPYNTTGTNNIGIGYMSLGNSTTTSYNIAIGTGSLFANSIGENNVGLGSSTLQNNTDGGSNIAIGREALTTNVNGGSNVAIGYRSLFVNTGSGNLALGHNAGYTLDGNSNNIIGYANTNLPDSNQLSIHNFTLSISKDKNGAKGMPHFWAPEQVTVSSASSNYILLADPNVYSAIFIDYSIEDDNGSMRAGTIKGIFDTTLANIKWDENATADIGSTVNYTFKVIDNGAGILGVELINNDTVNVYCNYTSRLINRATI